MVSDVALKMKFFPVGQKLGMCQEGEHNGGKDGSCVAPEVRRKFALWDCFPELELHHQGRWFWEQPVHSSAAGEGCRKGQLSPVLPSVPPSWGGSPWPPASVLWGVSLSWERFHRMCPSPPHTLIAIEVVVYHFLGFYFLF